MFKPKRLKPGSKIAIVSPCSGSPFAFPGLYEMGLKNLEEVFGFKLVEMPTARMSSQELYRNPKLRADDLNAAFADDSIDGIICSIGGYESVRILPYLDTEAILKNPKFIMGFSDATTFLVYLNKLGMITFYGPSVMAGFAQLKNLPEKLIRHLKDILFGTSFPYLYSSYDKWTNGYKDWRNEKTLGECTDFFNNPGWNFLNGGESIEGELWGGCIEVLEFLKSTDYWPEKEFWSNKIIVFETSEEKPVPTRVGYMLRNYGVQGILNTAKGIMFGRPKDYSEEEREELRRIILDIVREEFKAEGLVVVTDVDFGHTEPKIVLPLGCRVRLNPVEKEIVLLEDPFI